MSEQDGLIFAYALDGAGGGRALDWDGIGAAGAAGERPLWLHFNREGEESRRWIAEKSGLDPVVRQALLAPAPRPRCEAFPEGVLVILRGVNLNPGANPSDMVALRLWIGQGRVISVRQRLLVAVKDVRDQIEAGRGPGTTGELLVALSIALGARMAAVLENLDEQLDDLEEGVVTAGRRALRTRLSAVRREAIALRRYLSPQRTAMARLHSEQALELGAIDRERLREAADLITRYVEDLETSRERAAVVQDELMNRLAEDMDRTVYTLTVVAAVFLPLGFLTGLLGVNLGGMPGTDTPWAFPAFIGFILVLSGVELMLFRRLKWI